VFAIRLDPDLVTHEGTEFYQGSITIGDFRESFLASSLLWSPSKYQKQWRAAAAALAGGAPRSAFITSFVHPDAHHNVIWPAWRVGRDVYIQNRLLLRSQFGKIVDPERVADIVGHREAGKKGGEAISEWRVDVEDLEEFAA
jgi:contact-dependent growth inhibition (CDI) system CdiI-like immunity protein